MAAEAAGYPSSPAPPGFSDERTMWTSVVIGALAIRAQWKSAKLPSRMAPSSRWLPARNTVEAASTAAPCS